MSALILLSLDPVGIRSSCNGAVQSPGRYAERFTEHVCARTLSSPVADVSPCWFQPVCWISVLGQGKPDQEPNALPQHLPLFSRARAQRPCLRRQHSIVGRLFWALPLLSETRAGQVGMVLQPLDLRFCICSEQWNTEISELSTGHWGQIAYYSLSFPKSSFQNFFHLSFYIRHLWRMCLNYYIIICHSQFCLSSSF